MGPDRQDSIVQRRSELRAVYDRIAPHFSQTRAYAWPEVEAFVDRSHLRSARVGLDVGCGNGRHAALLETVTERVVALDASRGILRAADRRRVDRGLGYELVQGDALELPIVDDSVDVVLYVATLHHLPSHEQRVASLDELARVLAPGGRGLVSVWSVYDDRFDASQGFDTTLDWTLPDGTTLERYYHVYDRAEFVSELDSSELVLESVDVSSGNCYGTVAPS